VSCWLRELFIAARWSFAPLLFGAVLVPGTRGYCPSRIEPVRQTGHRLSAVWLPRQGAPDHHAVTTIRFFVRLFGDSPTSFIIGAARYTFPVEQTGRTSARGVAGEPVPLFCRQPERCPPMGWRLSTTRSRARHFAYLGVDRATQTSWATTCLSRGRQTGDNCLLAKRR